ncbi:MAG: helix-turn-helix transcriptional regulator [Reinekea sp.]
MQLNSFRVKNFRSINDSGEIHVSRITSLLGRIESGKSKPTQSIAQQEGRRITLEEISKATDIHRTTLSKVSNQKGYNTTTEVLDKLCNYFQVNLGQLAEHMKDEG